MIIDIYYKNMYLFLRNVTNRKCLALICKQIVINVSFIFR